MMMARIVLLLWMTALAAFAAEQPFRWEWKAEKGTLKVTLHTEEGSYVYRNATSLRLGEASPVRSPEAVTYEDSIMGKTEIYRGEASWCFEPLPEKESELIVSWQGCRSRKGSAPLCYPPETVRIRLNPEEKTSGILYPAEKTEQAVSSGELYPGVVVERTAFGYQNAEQFTAFLEGRENGGFSFAGKGILLVLILTLVGGLALNLTPCVLPMIPINLAIIGADSGGRRNAWIRGTVYAAGIAVAYGIVGLAAVLGGATFGALGSLWYFNLGVAVVFVILALSMFDVFSIDFSRFGGSVRTPSTAKLAGVFLLGGLSALLAGACVAPVVIAVLLYSAGLYADGNPFGLALPFLLGAGMGLPWPFVAAGLARVPKPGKWMVRVKYVFGIVILLAAGYYGVLGTRLAIGEFSAADRQSSAAAPASGTQALDDALLEAVLNGKPVLIDFWAEWCKNCKAMDRGPMRDPAVRKALENFNVVKLDATRVSDPQIKAVMERFRISGLPAFVIVKPAP